MAAREQLQYSQPSPTDIVLVDPNYIDNVMMDNVICHDNAWTTWGPMTSVSDGSIGSLDSPATKSGLKDERRKSNNRASYVPFSPLLEIITLTQYVDLVKGHIEIAKSNTLLNSKKTSAK